MVKMLAIAVTARYAKSAPVTEMFEFPVFDGDLVGLKEVLGGAVGVYKTVYHAKVVELQAKIRAGIKASMNGGEKAKSRKRDSNLTALLAG